MQYPAYDEYKASKFEWIDELPCTWGVTRLRLRSKRYSGGTPDKKKSEYWANGTIPWLNSGAVNQGIITEPSNYISELGFKESSAKWIPEKAVIIALAGQGKTKGTAAYTTFKTTCNQSMAAILFEEDCSRFMYWWLSSQYKNIRGLASDDGRDGLNLEMIGSIPCPIPPHKEQQKIAAFLDYKTGQIDALIEKKKELIKKLDEQRIAVITQAVTKGIDKSAKMKPSGRDWLGDIPEHWDIKKFRYLFSLGRGLGITKSDLKDDGIPCVNYGEIHSKFGFEVIPEKHDLKCVSDDYLDNGSSSLLENGDFVFADTSEDIEGSGNFTHLNSDTPTFAGYHTVTAKLTTGDIPRFIAYVFDSLMYRFQIRHSVTGVKVYSITQSILKSSYVWLPPKEEQGNIVKHLDFKLKKIDKMISASNDIIDKLNEYRFALITAAVTGKIDVRDVETGKGGE